MMSKEDLSELTREIRALGYDEQTASEYAVAIGDTPIRCADGRILVRDARGREVARLRLKFFDE